MKPLKVALLATLVSTGALFSSLNTGGAATLAESPANIHPGGTVTATWSAIAAPSHGDWIGLYVPSAGETSFRDWIYVSCNKSPGGASINGSCPFVIAKSLPFGTYELRLYSNDGFTRLATSAHFAVSPVRYVDNGDGTITDKQTGLIWERKLVIDDVSGNCADVNQANRSIHCLNNQYSWRTGGIGGNNGTLFTDFLASLNVGLLGTSADGVTIVAPNCFAGHCDWRIPNINEMQTLRDCSYGVPCIDPIFTPMGTGPYGYIFQYWSSTSYPSPNLHFAWIYGPYNGGFVYDEKPFYYFAVAVRGG